ncbi:hypothetical protein HanXRQr2_Chr10g0430521 [Helianthus annuus]|uniref:Uncharacterized protein n=1 Tax=Helianthus annuus TaxID=4232 RepID=A0A9K3N411_HELAN|nr:hypothetical protein HanXRQr2_Chr10g0430521 [Helianthus annuus]
MVLRSVAHSNNITIDPPSKFPLLRTLATILLFTLTSAAAAVSACLTVNFPVNL